MSRGICNRNWQSLSQFLLLITLVSLSAGCNLPASQATETLPPDMTRVYETVQAQLTLAISATPRVGATITPASTSQTSISSTLAIQTTSQTPMQGEVTLTQLASEACDLAGAGSPIDITVPDDTLMEPGQSFTKIWRLQNIGDCLWTTSYRVIFFSGERLGALENIGLVRQVSPGESVDIAIDMVAPTRAGTFQGNWKLRNPNGMAFGIGPSASAPFWVRIVVEVTPTPTASGTPTPTFSTTQTTPPPTQDTPVPSSTATEPPPASVTLTLHPGDALDLDSGEINSNAGSDVVYESNPDGLHRFSPQSETLMGIFGEQMPSHAECESAGLEPTSLVAMNLIQRYACYLTDLGQYGWVYLNEINPNTYTANLEIFTWTTP